MSTPKEIHLITPIITAGVRTLDDIKPLMGPGLKITHSLLAKRPPSIQTKDDEDLALPGIVERAIEVEKNGAAAIVVDCFGDPGVEEARHVVKIPVVGPGEILMHTVVQLGKMFSIVTILNLVVPLIEKLAIECGIRKRLVSIHTIDVPVLELEKRIGDVKRLLGEEAVKAVQEGASTILLGYIGFWGLDDKIRAALKDAGYDIPVIDPTPLAVCTAEVYAKLGLAHSKVHA